MKRFIWLAIVSLCLFAIGCAGEQGTGDGGTTPAPGSTVTEPESGTLPSTEPSGEVEPPAATEQPAEQGAATDPAADVGADLNVELDPTVDD